MLYPMFVFVSFCLYECLPSMPSVREGDAKVISVFSFSFFHHRVFVICIFHHSLGLSICGARFVLESCMGIMSSAGAPQPLVPYVLMM